LNQRLSENRAKSVYDYLISGKVDPARLVYKGYGKTMPIAPNTTDEDRAKNRRTEFKIIAK
jgi:outer membrane protein OmpA-like peptidoglycan-associated protein